MLIHLVPVTRGIMREELGVVWRRAGFTLGGTRCRWEL